MVEKKRSSRSGTVSDPTDRTWWRILLAVRRASLNGTRPFTVADVVGTAGMQETARSTREDMTSAWIGKLVRWGYVVQSGKADGPVRKIKTFEITKYGLERKEPGQKPVWTPKE